MSRRSLAARVANHHRWAKTEDRSAATAPAREAFMARFENENELREHMSRLALRKYQNH